VKYSKPKEYQKGYVKHIYNNPYTRRGFSFVGIFAPFFRMKLNKVFVCGLLRFFNHCHYHHYQKEAPLTDCQRIQNQKAHSIRNKVKRLCYNTIYACYSQK